MPIGPSKCNEIRQLLDMSYTICKQYKWLLDAYVADFYVHDYWCKLPRSWRESLKTLTPETIGNIIECNKPLQVSQVLPLSLLALRESIKCLQIPRKQVVDINKSCITISPLHNSNNYSSCNLNNLFWKRVKLKKKHEIELMSKMCYKLAVESNCFYIVDVGSGLGHLSRMLSYYYGFKVCSLEAEEYLTEEAKKLDQEMANTLEKYFKQLPTKDLKPVHINMKVKISSDGTDILKAISEAFQMKTNDLQFGIVGLHPCGDLGATLLQLFIKYPQVKFINIVGCCYMKLSESLISSHAGYPLSKFCKQKKYGLSYSSREVACHALEAYTNKLSLGQCWQLKVHAYRALLEKLIIKNWPWMFHSQISSVKYTNDLTFSEYCLRAVSKLGIKLDNADTESKEIDKDLKCWKNVVIFYSLRLMIAPLIETVILLDRIMYMLECGYQCDVTSIFDPQLSPRNQVLTGSK